MNNISLSILNRIKSRELKESVEDNSGDVKLFMNTWANYNTYGAESGITPTGWMTPDDADAYAKKYSEYEPFINDVDGYTPFDINENDDVEEVAENIKDYEECNDKDALAAILEYNGDNDVQAAIETYNNGEYIFYKGVTNDEELGRAVVDMAGSIKDAVPKDEINYCLDREEIKDSLDRDNTEEDTEVSDDEVEEYIDSMIESGDESFLDNYFDYESYGRDLKNEGYVITSTGAIQIF